MGQGQSNANVSILLMNMLKGHHTSVKMIVDVKRFIAHILVGVENQHTSIQ